MEHFHRVFFGRLLIACPILAILIPLGWLLIAGARTSTPVSPMGKKMVLTFLCASLANAACLYPLILSLHRRVYRFADDVLVGYLELASVMGAAIAQRDSETGDHNFRVTLYAFHLAEALEDPGLDLRVLLLGAFLHDVGKIGIRDAILLKPGPLTEAEMTVMRTHVRLGLQIIGPSNWLQLARKVIESHHERFDGMGYPHGLSGTAIPKEARLFAIVDAFDALTTARPYKGPLPLTEAMALLRHGAGSQFDPDMVATFNRIAVSAYRKIQPATEAQLQNSLKALLEHHRKALYLAGPLGPSVFQ